MSQRWKTLSIYIPEWDINGIKIADINVSVVKAIYIPRNYLSKGLERKELKQPGIYFLFGSQNDIGKLQIYVWESEVLEKRLRQHDNWKDFWDNAVCFISEKNNLTKAHIKFLEHHCDKLCRDNTFLDLQSGNIPTQSSLDESNAEMCYSFFDDMKVILSTLWYSIFWENKKDKNDMLVCKGKWIEAYWYYNNNMLTVTKWSYAWWWKETWSALWTWVSGLRAALIEKGILKLVTTGKYQFTEDYVFTSLSAGAAVVLGRSANWRTEWKDSKWKTIDKIARSEK